MMVIGFVKGSLNYIVEVFLLAPVVKSVNCNNFKWLLKVMILTRIDC